MIGMDNSDQRYGPNITEAAAGWVIGAVILVDCLIIVAIGLAAMWIFG